jgi:RNA polymerase sigma factor (sigma-70 family)
MGVVTAPSDTPVGRGSYNLEVREARELLEANLALITRAVAFACRRYRFDPDDAEEFGAIVNLKLVDDDYAVLRSYEGRAGLATFLSVVIQRWALDFRIHEWGKWHPSAEAKRAGAVAVELEQILHRDGRTVEEALPFLRTKHAGVTLDSLKAIAVKLPRRAPKRHDVPVEEAAPVSGPYDIEDQARANDRRRTARHVATLLHDAIERRPEDLRLILQLRFVNGMTVAQIARALQREQKLLYRMLERCMHEIQDEIVAAGVRREDVLDLIGRDDVPLAFDLGKSGPRPSMKSDERVAATTEGPG